MSSAQGKQLQRCAQCGAQAVLDEEYCGPCWEKWTADTFAALSEQEAKRYRPPDPHLDIFDHPFCPPEERAACPVKLRTAEQYSSMGACLYQASNNNASFRTCEEDPDPTVVGFEHVVSPEDALSIIEAAKPHMHRAQIGVGEGEDTSHSSDSRTNTCCWLPHDHCPAIERVVAQISEIVGLNPTHAEALQVIHYSQGQQYKKHWDGYHPSSETGQQELNNRLVTAIVYLNEVEEGGGIQFVNMNFVVDPTPGLLLVFHNCYPDTRATHSDTNHAGLPVVRGEKWACNLWFCQEPKRWSHSSK